MITDSGKTHQHMKTIERLVVEREHELGQSKQAGQSHVSWKISLLRKPLNENWAFAASKAEVAPPVVEWFDYLFMLHQLCCPNWALVVVQIVWADLCEHIQTIKNFLIICLKFLIYHIMAMIIWKRGTCIHIHQGRCSCSEVGHSGSLRHR